jgi:exodeoxyribonuclease-3
MGPACLLTRRRRAAHAYGTSRHITVVATRGFDASPVDPAPFDPRVVCVDLAAEERPIRVVGVYAPRNGMTADSSLRRRAFQDQFMDYLAAICRPALCVAGDLNVIEPGHQPPLPGFEVHDYAFYTRLTGLGLRDDYRSHSPDGGDHSWFSPRFGSQRQKLTDHAALLLTVSLDVSS